MSARTLRAWVAVSVALQASLAGGAARGASAVRSGWSTPRPLDACANAAGPRVAFPSESPSVSTGPGAIVWVEDQGCNAGSARAAPGPFDLSLAALGPDEHATVAGVQRLPGASPGALESVGASHGRVAVAASLGAGSSPAVALLQGRAGRPPAAGTPLPGRLFSLAHAYLGDAAVATVRPGAIEVRVERYFRSAFERPLRIPIEAGPVSALVATMDYRSDVLVAWQQSGAIYAHMLRASGRAEPTQRVGESAPHPQLQALVSDNDHGMIAWCSAGSRPAPAGASSVRIAFSGAGVRFTGSRLIASFSDPLRVWSVPGSLALVRLSSENVMLSWTDAERGHYVVRAAPAVFAGTHRAARLSDPRAQSVLGALAPGPAGEAVAVWRSAPAQERALDAGPNELWAARTFIERHGRVGLRAPEIVAGAAAHGAPSAAVDPRSDRAVAAWLELGAHPRVEYATGPGASGYRPTPASALASRGGGHSRRIALAAAAAAAILALIALALRRRAAARRGGGASTGTRRRG